MQAPRAALFRHQGGRAVFCIVEGAASLAPVTLGHRNGTEAEVTGGLEPGDRVIPHPAEPIADGTPMAERAAE